MEKATKAKGGKKLFGAAAQKVLEKKARESGEALTEKPAKSVNAAKKPVGSKNKRAGLEFPVTRIHKKIRDDRVAERCTWGGAVFLAGVMEYLVAEVLELAGNCAKENKKKTINPRYLMMAMRGDEELNELAKDVTFPQAGVVGYIHANLLPKDKKRAGSESMMK